MPNTSPPATRGTRAPGQPGFDPEGIDVIVFDVFGTTVDSRAGVTAQASVILRSAGLDVDPQQFVTGWNQVCRTELCRVQDGEREFAVLDQLRREALDRFLSNHPGAAALGTNVRQRLVRTFHALPAWPDVIEGLERLRRRYTVAALSDGGFALLTNLIKVGDLPFDCAVSAQLARTYKPGLRAYLIAAELLDTDPDRILMAAAHGWDLDGARAAGFHTAYVQRPHRPAEPDCATPDLNVADFIDLAETLGC